MVYVMGRRLIQTYDFKSSQRDDLKMVPRKQEADVCLFGKS